MTALVPEPTTLQGNATVAAFSVHELSSLVERKPLAQVVDDILGWLTVAVRAGQQGHVAPPQAAEGGCQILDWDIDFVWVADSLLVFTRRDTDEAVCRLLSTVGWLIQQTALTGVPHLCAGVSYGQVHIDRSRAVFMGRPIEEARVLEAQQNWSGAALTPSACNRVPAHARNGESSDWWVTPWLVPLKNGSKLPTLAVNWNLRRHAPGWHLRWSLASTTPTVEAWVRDAGRCERFMNSKDFHEAHCPSCATHEAAPLFRSGTY